MSIKAEITIRAYAAAAAIAGCAVIAATPALAADGEILINQAKVNAGGITPGDTAGFPATLSRPGRYKLSGNLAVPAGVYGIVVTAHNVTVDLNGFTIRTNPPPGTSVGVYSADNGSSSADFSGLRVLNGTITGFGGPAVYIEGGRAVIENMRLIANGAGIRAGAESRIRNSTIVNNGGYGVACGECLIEQSIVSGNDGMGAFLFSDRPGQVLGSVIVGNASFGLESTAPNETPTGYGNNILLGNNAGGVQVFGSVRQLHPNACNPSCP